jgi:hypothetical protein
VRATIQRVCHRVSSTEGANVGLDYDRAGERYRTYADGVRLREAQELRRLAHGYSLRPPWSDEGAKPRDRLPDDQRVHLASALIGVDGLGVGDETANVIFEQNAIAA